MNSQLERQIKTKLYTQNEYGYEYRNLDAELEQEEIDYLAKEYGIETTYKYDSGVEVPLRPMCINCKAATILKYKSHSSFDEQKPFEVECKGVPNQFPPGTAQVITEYSTKNNIDREKAKRIIAATVDPLAWFELMFNFNVEGPSGEKEEVRPYQREELRCTAKRRAFRWGRRSGKTFTAAGILLYSIFNKKYFDGFDEDGKPRYRGPSILVATPFQSQLVNVFEQLEALLKKNGSLRERVTTGTNGGLYVQSPFFRMEFDNGAKIWGFVTGVEIKQDGSAGGSIRGQSGDIVYVDEMDMIPEDIIKKVIIPILFTHSHTEFIVSSTPIGKAGEFAKFCLDTPRYRESYFPSTVLPHWENVKAELSDLDPRDDSFIAEYMAGFIESASGVFKALYVYDSMKDYSYADSKLDNAAWWRGFAQVPNRSDLINVIGIDWNKNAGSEFVVVSYHVPTNRYWIAEATNISAGQFSSHAFKQEVKRLNYVWSPSYIYADEGYGHTIIEDLLYESQEMLLKGPTTPLEQSLAKIAARLKSFNFSQKVELKNPINGTEITKTGKEFLVENAVRVFESGALNIPVADNVLRKQLLNYIVLRRHPSNNKPVYGMKSQSVGDHRLDALMLALGGIFLELNPLYSKSFWLGKNDFKQIVRVPQSEIDETELRYENYKILSTKIGVKDSERQRAEVPTASVQNTVFDALFKLANKNTIDPERKGSSSPRDNNPISKIGILNRKRTKREIPWH